MSDVTQILQVIEQGDAKAANGTRVDVHEVELPLPMPGDELLALHEALELLATVDSRAAEVVRLRFFVGLTQERAGKQLGISLATRERIWSFARAWLSRKMQKTRGGPG